MIGCGSAFFAIWGYVIAKMRPDKEVGAQVELNPKLLAFIIGEEENVIETVILKMCSPDPKSRTKDEEGKKLIRMGEFDYRVVNGPKYIAIRTEEERREQNRRRQADSRAKHRPPTKRELARVQAQNESRERRHGQASSNGDTDLADRIAAEDLPGGL